MSSPGLTRVIHFPAEESHKKALIPPLKSGTLSPRLYSSPNKKEREKMLRQNFSSGSKWEPLIGYSRLVKAGNMLFVSGTTGSDKDGKISGGAYAQTRQALLNIESALKTAGASMKDVVRTRIFCTSLDEWQEIGRAHGEFFGEIRPATAMVGVKQLVAPEMIVEIEADAVLTA